MCFKSREHCIVDDFYIKGRITTRIPNVNQNSYSSAPGPLDGLTPFPLLLCGDACSYASTIRWTSSCRTTSTLEK